MKTFGDRVRARREELGMSQEGLGKAAGISQSTVAQIERGRNQGTKHILGLVRALGVRADWLERGRGEMLETAKHKIGTEDASIRSPKSGLIKDSPTSRSHRIGELSVESDDANVLPRDIPILSYEKAGQMTPLVDPWTHDESLGKVTINKPYSLSTFAIPIRDASMHPRFEEGLDFPIIDPARPAAPGKCVLARTRTGETVFRKYREIGMNERGEMVFELAPVNDDFATLHSERDGLVIIGRMVAYTHYEEE